MIKTKKFNDISPELLPELPRGKVAYFKVCGIKIGEGGKPIIRTLNVPATDTVFDTIKKQYVDIALVDKVGANDSTEFMEVWFEPSSAGILALNGDRARDVKIYQYMMLSNYRKSATNRDESKPELYELVDEESKNKEFFEKFNEVQGAVAFASKCSIELLKEIAAAKGLSIELYSEESLRRWAIESALKNPKEFMDVSVTQDRTVMAIINASINRGIIEYSANEGCYLWKDSRDVILHVHRAVRDKLDKIVQFAKDNEQFLNALTKLVNG